MIVKRHILDTLTDLEERYTQASTSSLEQIYYSKLAILEYCGWIEEAFDNIARRCVKNKLKTQPYKQMLEDSVIGGNHGFQYKTNIRPMMIKAIGLREMEKIEVYLKTSGKLEILISELDAVKVDRDNAAHTWVLNTTRTYPAPSVTKSRLNKIYPIAKEIYTYIVNQ